MEKTMMGMAEIDEGYPDRDADGIADCLDDQCTPQRGYTAEVAIADTCWTPGSVTDPWDIEVAWTVPYYPKDRRYAHVFQTATGRVADTNRDGVVTAEDDAAVVVAFHDTLLSGIATGRIQRTGRNARVANGSRSRPTRRNAATFGRSPRRWCC